MKKLLVVVDYQTDFVTGALANPLAEPLEAGIAARVTQHLAEGGAVIFTLDTHPDTYGETREGRFLPAAHCIRGTEGWQLHGALRTYMDGIHDNVMLVEKGAFGAASLPGAAMTICGGVPQEIEICGVVTDICVISNAILLHSAFLETPVKIRADLCAAMSKEQHENALNILHGMGYDIVKG